MNKKELKYKRMVIRIPELLMNKFKDACDINYKTMSQVLRDYIQQYIKEIDAR